MKTLIPMLVTWLGATQVAMATPQTSDTIVIGHNTFGIFQLPMDQYWHFDDEAPDGRFPMPAFEVTSSANWRGYTAKWIISRGKLKLLNIEGQIAGKKVTNRQIIKKRFPLHARWFSGRIFVSIGGFDETANRHLYVIEFRIENGNVVETVFHESAVIPMTLDGMPNDVPANDGEPSHTPEEAVGSESSGESSASTR